MSSGGNIKGCRCAHCQGALQGKLITLFAAPVMRDRFPFGSACEGSSAPYGEACVGPREDDADYAAYCLSCGVEPPADIPRLRVRPALRLVVGEGQ